MSWGRTLGLAAIAALALTGCKSAAVNSTPIVTSPTNESPSTSPATAAPTVAHTGMTVRVSSGSEAAEITLTKVVDPATGADQFSIPDTGKRFVAVVLNITAGSNIQGDADNDVTVIGSDGQTYTADFDAVQGCTDFDHGTFTLSTGDSAKGCVTVQVPAGVSVAKVRFSPAGGFPGATIGEWVNP